MSKIRVFIFAFFLIGLFSQSMFGKSSEAKKIDAFIAPFVKAGHFSGVVLVSKNGRVIYEKAFGLANAELNIPNRLYTRIGLASITKPMTSVILLRLIEAGKIALDDKVSKYLPAFPNGDKITVEMLSRHRAGIPHRVMPSEMESIAYTSAEMVKKIGSAPLEFEPGTSSLYSSAGYTVLARVLEIASGKSYQQLLDEFVFTPAGMKDSVDAVGDVLIERRAQDYLFDSKGIYNALLKNYSFLVGAGSVFSTARDTHKFGEAFIKGTYGENVRLNFVRDGVFSSNGSTNGHRAFVKINDPKKYGYVILSNLSTGAFDFILPAVENILEGKQVEVPVIPNPKIISNPNPNPSEFFGIYRRENGSRFELKQMNGAFYAGDIKLEPIKPDCFFEFRFYGEVCFARDEAGRIKNLSWKSPGLTSIWTKTADSGQ